MERMKNNRLFHGLLLFTVAGEFLLPWILGHYDGRTMLIGVSGGSKSPVCRIYNSWLIWLGCFLLFTAAAYFFQTREKFPVLSVFVFLSIGFFAIAAGALPGIYGISGTKAAVATAAGIHVPGGIAGFMALLFFPLLNGILAFKQKDTAFCAVSIAAFVLAVVFFCMFAAADREVWKNTLLAQKGLWRYAALFCMHVPFICRSVRVLVS